MLPRDGVKAEFAEALAIKEALSCIKHKGWQEVTLESDCLAVVQAVRSNVEMRSSFGQVVADCRSSVFICYLLNDLLIWLLIVLQERQINTLIVVSIGVMFLMIFKIVLD